MIQLQFLSFDVEYESNCSYDSVKVYDGKNRSAPLMHTYCGNNLPDDVISSNNSLFVFFQSDDSVTKDGFLVRYRALASQPGKHYHRYFSILIIIN